MEAKIIKQGWYKEIAKRWHQDDKFNLSGEHVTFIDLGDKTVDDIDSTFAVRNTTTSVTIKFKDGTYFNYDMMHDALYLSTEFDRIGNNKIRVRVPLSWYCLGYSHKLIGAKESKSLLV